MEVSNAVVRIYKERFGRGPTKSRTHYAGSDALITTVEQSLTQAAAERDFVDAIERITGRKVRAFVSGTDTHRDVSSEVFYFEPEPDTAPA